MWDVENFIRRTAGAYPNSYHAAFICTCRMVRDTIPLPNKYEPKPNGQTFNPAPFCLRTRDKPQSEEKKEAAEGGIKQKASKKADIIHSSATLKSYFLSEKNRHAMSHDRND